MQTVQKMSDPRDKESYSFSLYASATKRRN